MADQQTPQEFGKKLRDAVGLTEDQTSEILRSGLLDFQQRLPFRPKPQVTFDPPPTFKKVETIDVSTPSTPPNGLLPELPRPALQNVDPQGTGGSGEITAIWIIEDGAPVEYNFSATPA